MCRLFGFRSVLESGVHQSLVRADNALVHQSEEHPDGWGVGYYVAGAPHIVKSVATAVEDSLFERVSGIVSSQTVLAHLRKATLGDLSIINTHPFQYGPWLFAHNGNIKNFDSLRPALVAHIHSELRSFVLGDTDSELLFFLILTHLQKRVALSGTDCPLDVLVAAIRETVELIVSIAGDYSTNNDGDPMDTYLSFILTNGQTIMAHHGGKDMYYSTHKKHCSERDVCPKFVPQCEQANQSGFVSHMIFSSEILSGENVWNKMTPGQMIGVDKEMNLTIFNS